MAFGFFLERLDEVSGQVKSAKGSFDKAKLVILIEAFDEIDAGFEMSGFGGVGDSGTVSDDQSSDGSVFVDEGEEQDDDYEGLSSAGYDREEIEVGIDAFLSCLSKARLIRKNSKGRLPSFAQVFELLFVDDDTLSTKAREFEEFIKGYFGFVSYEDMRDARERFQEIKAILQGKLMP